MQKTQNIKFSVKFVFEIYEIIYNILIDQRKGNSKEKQILNKDDFYAIRSQIMEKYNLFIKDKIIKTNYFKKLAYLIEKIYLEFIQIFKKYNQSFEMSFILLLKKILYRGSNYFGHNQIYLINNIINNDCKHESFFNYLRMEFV
jgi:hypothetical protein